MLFEEMRHYHPLARFIGSRVRRCWYTGMVTPLFPTTSICRLHRPVVDVSFTPWWAQIMGSTAGSARTRRSR